jgi:hypothetical protein
MADLKISQLTSASLPLAGTEVLPIVQSSATKKVATDDLTVKNVRSNATTGILQIAGPAAAATRTMTVPDANFTAARTDAANSFTGDQTLGTGNLIQGTAGKGINFTANANAAGMTSELLNWYEEGTWTPALAFGGASTGITYNAQAGTYTRIGRLVHCFARLSLSSKGSASGSATITGLPFTSASNDASLGGNMYPSLYASMALVTGLNGYIGSSSTTINLGNDGATETGSINATNFTNTTTIYFSVQYYV